MKNNSPIALNKDTLISGSLHQMKNKNDDRVKINWASIPDIWNNPNSQKHGILNDLLSTPSNQKIQKNHLPCNIKFDYVLDTNIIELNPLKICEEIQKKLNLNAPSLTEITQLRETFNDPVFISNNSTESLIQRLDINQKLKSLESVLMNSCFDAIVNQSQFTIDSSFCKVLAGINKSSKVFSSALRVLRKLISHCSYSKITMLWADDLTLNSIPDNDQKIELYMKKFKNIINSNIFTFGSTDVSVLDIIRVEDEIKNMMKYANGLIKECKNVYELSSFIELVENANSTILIINSISSEIRSLIHLASSPEHDYESYKTYDSYKTSFEKDGYTVYRTPKETYTWHTNIRKIGIPDDICFMILEFQQWLVNIPDNLIIKSVLSSASSLVSYTLLKSCPWETSDKSWDEFVDYVQDELLSVFDSTENNRITNFLLNHKTNAFDVRSNIIKCNQILKKGKFIIDENSPLYALRDIFVPLVYIGSLKDHQNTPLEMLKGFVNETVYDIRYICKTIQNLIDYIFDMLNNYTNIHTKRFDEYNNIVDNINRNISVIDIIPISVLNDHAEWDLKKIKNHCKNKSTLDEFQELFLEIGKTIFDNQKQSTEFHGSIPLVCGYYFIKDINDKSKFIDEYFNRLSANTKSNTFNSVFDLVRFASENKVLVYQNSVIPSSRCIWFHNKNWKNVLRKFNISSRNHTSYDLYPWTSELTPVRTLQELMSCSSFNEFIQDIIDIHHVHSKIIIQGVEVSLQDAHRVISEVLKNKSFIS